MTYNKKLTFAFVTTILLFNLVSVLAEFSYFAATECDSDKPTRLRRRGSTGGIDTYYISFRSELKFFGFLGLIFNFAALLVLILFAH